MKRNGKYRSMLLALLLSLAMVVTYMPAWMITYAEDEISNQTEIELNEENAAGDSAADVTGETGSAAGEITNDSGDTEETGDPSDEQTDEQTDGAKGPTGLEEEGVEGDSLLTEEGKDLDDLDNELEEEEPTENKRTVLAFTSDIHNASDNTAANRLDSWLDIIQDKYDGEIDVMSFCGDMGAASANESQFWTYTTSVMNVVVGENIPGIYTTGNHEFYNGKYSSTTNSVKGEYIVGEEGINGSNFRIYCLGTDNWNNNQDNYTTGQISKLNSYLNSVGSDKPIIILTHYPLHRASSRATTNADKVIDTLNDAVASGKKIVLLWGHNHSVNDDFYDQIYEPGTDIVYNSGGSTKKFNFYYGAAGCMSDSEYGSGSAFVKGKGLVITINAKNQLSFTYYNANGTNVTEGGTYTEKDPVSAQGISLSPETLEIEENRSGRISVTFTPSDTTNQGVIWTSSDTSVATVTNGKVKGVSVGTAIITATSADGGFTASCAITVTERTSTDPEYIIKMGDYVLSNVHSDDVYSSGGGSSYPWGGGGSSNKYYGLEAVEYAKAAKNDDSISWTITEADDGNGYYITDSEGNYLNATYSSSGSSMNSSSQGDLKVDGTKDIWVLDDGITLDNWEVDGSYLKSCNTDRYLAQVTGAGGTEMFTNRSQSSAAKTYIEDTSALSDAVNATAITVSPKTLSVEIGASKKLSVTYTPSTTTNKNVTWTSSDTSVATVSATGQVTGVAKGKATITATYSDGVLTDTAEVTVTKAAGSGVTPEVGRKYVILAGDGYALTSEGEEAGYTNGSDTQKYYYYGLSGEPYTVGEHVSPERLLWTFTAANRAGTQYYIQDQNGKYLNGSYEANDEGGYTGRLALSDKQDIWVITGATSGDTVSGNILQSTNASASDAGAKFLTHGNGDNGGDNTNIFTLRSEDNATAAIFYEYDDSGTYVPDPDDPTPDDPTPTVTSVDITPTTDNPSESAKINVGDTLTINVKNGSSSSAYDFTATLSSSGIARIEGDASVHIVAGGTGQFAVKGLADGTVDINIQNGNNSHSRKGVVHLTVGEGSTPDDPTPTDGDRYEEVTTLEDGKEYIIAVTKDDGSVYAINNTGSPVSSLTLNVTAASGDASAYIETNESGVVWTYTASNKYFINDGDYLYPSSSNGVMTYSSGRAIDYADGKLSFSTSSSGTYYITCSDGSFNTSKTEGDAANIRIFAKSDGGETPDTPVESVELDKTSMTLTEGETGALTATVKPATAANKNVTWASSDETVATVDQTGKVSAVKAGIADITVTTEDGGKFATCAVTVEAPAPQPEGTKYVLTNTLEAGKEYVIASTNAAGNTYILGHDGTNAATYSSTVVNENGELSISESKEEVSFEAAAITNGFSLINGDYYMIVEGSGDLTFSTSSSTKYWNYSSDNKLSNSSNSATRYLTFSGSEFKGYYSSSNPNPSDIFLYVEKVEEGECEHEWGEWTVTTEPTCTEAGVETRTCSKCGETEKRSVDALGHNLTSNAAHAATCTETGNSAYWSCSTCGKYFSDAEGANEIEENSWVISATGHTPVTDDAVPATCTETGLTEGSHCSVCGTVFVAQETVAALGHKWSDWSVTTPATCTGAGVETRTCERCDETETRNIEKLGHKTVTDDAVPATCTGTGLTEGSHCSVCGTVFVAQETVAALGHKWSDWSVTTPATCTEAGVETRTCERCGETETRDIEKLGHKTVTDAAVPATCTGTGLTEGSHCSVCGTVFVAQEVIPATGHALTHIPAKAATTSSEGNIEYWYCSTCKKYFADAEGQTEIAQAATIIPKLPDDTGGGSSGGDTPSGGGGGVAPGGDTPESEEPTITPEDEAKPVNEAIGALSSDAPDPAAVAAARDAYEKLSDEAKKSVPPETLKKLEAAEATVIANAQKAEGAETVVVSGTVTVTSTENKTVAFTAASSSKRSITIPASVEIAGEIFTVTEISSGAFKDTAATTVTISKNIKKVSGKAFSGSKATKLIVKSKKLTKKSVKNSLKGSKVKTVKVKVGTWKQNKAYVKKYKKIFTKTNAGKKVTVK